jgi:hypothetical protein
MALILHNSAWTLLKATTISYVLRQRRNKDYSELFSGLGKTKAFLQIKRLGKPNFGFLQGQAECFSVKGAVTGRIYSKS